VSTDPGPGLSQAPSSTGTGTAVLDQAFDAGSLYALRAAVSAHAAEAGLPRQRVYDVVAAAHELAANAVRHGAGHGRLRLWANGRSLYCQVSDDGPPDQGAVTPEAAAWLREHAHGLWIIDQIADHVSLDHDGGTTVTATFTISSPG
jgi:anti-sigma regulatory factor (Ser/Thr protein kinase)